MDPILTPSLIAGGLNLASGLITNLFNKNQSDKANQITQQNNAWQQAFAEDERDWNRQQYLDEQAYNRQLQETMFQREDNAYQRTSADLQQAGYSPLAINGVNNAGSVVGNSSHDTSATIPELSSINPFQAQNLNFGQIADILGQADSREVQRERNRIEAEKNLSDTEQADLDRKQRERHFQNEMTQRINQFESTQNEMIRQFNLKDEQKNRELAQKDSEIQRLNTTMEFEQTKTKQEYLLKAVKAVTGYEGRAHYVPDSEYDEAYSLWASGLSDAYKQAQTYLEEHAKSLSESEQNSLSGSLGANIPGTSIGGNLQASKSDGQMSSKAYEVLFQSQNIIRKYLINNSMPVKDWK